MSLSLLKKPHNIIQGPEYPFIQKELPRFVWAKKSWNVDVGNVLKNTETNLSSCEGSILAVSKDENKDRYGVKSYTPKINKNFRYSLEYLKQENNLPLSRLPRPSVVGRINPGGFIEARNNLNMDVSSMITDKRLNASVRPTFFYKMDKTMSEIYNDKLPKLELKMPQVSAESGVNRILERFEGNTSLEKTKLDFHNPQVQLHINPVGPYTMDQETPLVDLQLEQKIRNAEPISAGIHIPFNKYQETPLSDLQLGQKLTTSAQTNPSVGIDMIDYTLQDTKAATHNKLNVSYQETPITSYTVNNFNPNVKLGGARYYAPEGYAPGVSAYPTQLQNQKVNLKQKLI